MIGKEGLQLFKESCNISIEGRNTREVKSDGNKSANDGCCLHHEELALILLKTEEPLNSFMPRNDITSLSFHKRIYIKQMGLNRAVGRKNMVQAVNNKYFH